MIGWGITADDVLADVLQEGVMNYVENVDCDGVWRYEAGDEVTDSMMCALKCVSCCCVVAVYVLYSCYAAMLMISICILLLLLLLMLLLLLLLLLNGME